jgi:hypothetical protein
VQQIILYSSLPVGSDHREFKAGWKEEERKSL